MSGMRTQVVILTVRLYWPIMYVNSPVEKLLSLNEFYIKYLNLQDNDIQFLKSSKKYSQSMNNEKKIIFLFSINCKYMALPMAEKSYILFIIQHVIKYILKIFLYTFYYFIHSVQFNFFILFLFFFFIFQKLDIMKTILLLMFTNKQNKITVLFMIKLKLVRCLHIFHVR